MNLHNVGDLVLAALLARVFGGDAAYLLRRAAAAGVRLGVSELTRDRRKSGVSR